MLGNQDVLNLSSHIVDTQHRRGSRIQKGGFVHSEGGGGSYRNFRSGSKLLQGPGQINKQKKLQTAVGGVSDHPKKKPVSAHEHGIDNHFTTLMPIVVESIL